MTCKTINNLPSTLAERATLPKERNTPARRQSQRSPLESARSDEEAQRPRSGQAGEPLPRGLVAPLEEMYFQPEAESAICVQSFDDSLNSAIRTTYRISLRSSSLREPRYPSAGVVGFHKLRQRRRESPLAAQERGPWGGETHARARGAHVHSTLAQARDKRGAGPGRLRRAPRTAARAARTRSPRRG